MRTLGNTGGSLDHGQMAVLTTTATGLKSGESSTRVGVRNSNSMIASSFSKAGPQVSPIVEDAGDIWTVVPMTMSSWSARSGTRKGSRCATSVASREGAKYSIGHLPHAALTWRSASGQGRALSGCRIAAASWRGTATREQFSLAARGIIPTKEQSWEKGGESGRVVGDERRGEGSYFRLSLASDISGGDKKRPCTFVEVQGLVENISGDVLLSHTVASAVPSAPKSLTSEFGKGSGRASSISSPEKRWSQFVVPT